MVNATFDLGALFAAIDADRERRVLSWAALSREVGVAPSTIRRYAGADDAEADGVLVLVRWLGMAPEIFVIEVSGAGDLLPGGRDTFVRLDMDRIRATTGARIPAGRTRTTIQRLVQVADGTRPARTVRFEVIHNVQ